MLCTQLRQNQETLTMQTTLLPLCSELLSKMDIIIKTA